MPTEPRIRPLRGGRDPRESEHAERSEFREAQGNGAGRAEHEECAYGGVGGNSSGRKGRKTREGSKGGSGGKIVGAFLILLFAMAGGWWLMNKSDISHVPMDNAPSSVSNVQSGSTSGVNVEGVGGQCVITDLQRQVSIFSGKMIAADVIVEMLGLHVGADLALIDFKKKREYLLKRIPTLRNVSISRKSPDRVEIVAEERVPIAKLGVRGREGLTGRVVDSEGMVFPCLRGTRLLPTIVELPPSWTAIGQQLKGRSLAALRLVEMCHEPEFSDLAVSEIDIANPDYLLVTLGESHVQAKIAWAGMDSPNDNRSDDLKVRLTKLQSAIHTNTTGGVKLWNATLSDRVVVDWEGTDVSPESGQTSKGDDLIPAREHGGQGYVANGKTSTIKHSKVQLWEGGPYWADRNIGAENPWDYGYYFWWGDPVGYKRENNKWVATDGSSANFSFTDNNTPTCGKDIGTLRSEGWITADNVLSAEHDAAQVQWGGEWRMPTKQEMDDLCKKCDWTWTTMEGVRGYIVRGRGGHASDSIFLPCVGGGYGTSLYVAGSNGNYWSSVPYSGNNLARRLIFGSSDHGTYNYYRYSGQSIRPVQGFTK